MKWVDIVKWWRAWSISQSRSPPPSTGSQVSRVKQTIQSSQNNDWIPAWSTRYESPYGHRELHEIWTIKCSIEKCKWSATRQNGSFHGGDGWGFLSFIRLGSDMWSMCRLFFTGWFVMVITGDTSWWSQLLSGRGGGWPSGGWHGFGREVADRCDEQWSYELYWTSLGYIWYILLFWVILRGFNVSFSILGMWQTKFYATILSSTLVNCIEENCVCKYTVNDNFVFLVIVHTLKLVIEKGKICTTQFTLTHFSYELLR